MSIICTYQVRLVRVDPKAGSNANLYIEVVAANSQTAKHIAESQCHGYRATGAVQVR